MEKIEVGEVFTIGDGEQEEEVEVVASMTVDGQDYVAVAFTEDLRDDIEEDIEVFFLKVDEDGDFDVIESDEEYDKVVEAFDEILEEEE
ncbi:DUF1292 domain-containing protein [Ureibacillus sp. FSL K6-8385]|uniref:DUF1292 domain-containing protein n=1 Tax=Ureibacillus terrenus TaxID=118246 RepID=A0A540V5L5_9BACL|nr:DUF1292 domain-containing protein [Ureibacillus terrenus]MED3661242.1 DUF1292 domain-containing protein [Ureibacillus terrenus]TQE92031.1 DUF1292 domain-containing protein [Ureibacillus terrenus]